MSLKSNAWEPEANLPEPVSRHCAVQAKDDSIYIIGGHEGTSSFSDETIDFNILTSKSSTIVARLNRGRQLHSCAMLDANHIIVVGGRSERGALKTAETLDTKTSDKWIERKNLELPTGISYAQLVSNSSLGVEFFNIFK